MAVKKSAVSFPWAVLGIIGAAAMLFLLYHQLGLLQAARQERAAEGQTLERTRQHLRQLENTRDHAALLQLQLQALEQAIPTGAGEDELIEYMQRIADNTGSGFIQLTFGERSSKEGYTEMPFTVSFQGRYQGLVDLLGELQYGGRIITIDQLKIGKGQDELPNLRADITCKTYYRNK
ncbi:type IV pilus biogenesis protein PilO [Desulfocucumis palustris]|uniref:Type IV pilus biogenesis protein PilO n=1 Tax=Desulfocucumis palustris TaxID=1898651 RepID=A0A2L2X9N6_9FIRM|nr:type 4a pilus biogenesis protein PilO [Desulfocucumis palustris]GBF32760.1 type IV pilus biogenesis protein PilO [Desulfocucumis palustris]